MGHKRRNTHVQKQEMQLYNTLMLITSVSCLSTVFDPSCMFAFFK